MSDALTIAAHALREAVRRRVLLVVALLTAAFLGLYALAAFEAFDSLEGTAGGGFVRSTNRRWRAGRCSAWRCSSRSSSASVLAIFLTLGAVRGDAERGLLQPLVVRPVGRTTLLVGRLVRRLGRLRRLRRRRLPRRRAHHRRPATSRPARSSSPPPASPSASSPSSRSRCSARPCSGPPPTASRSSWSSPPASPPACWARSAKPSTSPASTTASSVASWLVPFEALYQNGLHALTADIGGATGVIVQLGPLGGADDVSAAIWPWAMAWSAAVMALAALAFRRRDL